MNESFITVQGYVGSTVLLRQAGDHKVASFRLGVTPRKLDRATGQWHDGETQWYSVSAWRTLGENVTASLRKGDPVVVQGRLTARTWINASHAEVISYEIEATHVGHDLHRGTTHFQKSARPGAEPIAEQQAAPESADVMAGAAAGVAAGTAAGTAAEAPREAASRADWNPPLHEAPDLAGAA
jgi:single-strand DNA-binding protein